MSNAPVNYAVWSSEYLPEGLSLSESGLLTGRPTVSGSYESHIQLRTNWGIATKTISLAIEEPSYGVEITNDNSSAINFYYYKSSSYTFTGNYKVPASETSQPVTWTISGLPSGVSANNLNSNNLTISGYPASTGNYTLRLGVKKGSYSASKNFTLKVSSDGKGVSITTSSLPYGQQGKKYSVTLEATNTTNYGPVQYYVSGLPSGLTCGYYNGRYGVISGTPTIGGKSSTVVVYATAGVYRSPEKIFSLYIYTA